MCSSDLFAGAVVYSASISAGGFQGLNFGGAASGTRLLGGFQAVDSGFAQGTAIFSGGTQNIYDNGSAVGTVISSGGQQLIGQMQPVWKAMTAAIAELTDTPNNLMKAIAEVEAKFEEKSFVSRAKTLLR